MTTTLGYVITAEAIERERQRVRGDDAQFDLSRVLELREIELPTVGCRDVMLRILAVSAEHNVVHAAAGHFVNAAQAQGGRLVPGNSAVGEVMEVGRDVRAFEVGDVVQTHCNGLPDRHGYPERIWGFDLIGAAGCYARHAVVGDWQISKLPLDCGLNLWELAALPLRAPTAYHLLRRGLDIYRVKVPREQRARLNVMSFGGGVGELFLMMAKAEGHDAYYCSGSRRRRAALAERGIVPIDQHAFHRFAEESDIRAFRAHCRELTRGEGMHVVCDLMRGPVFAAGLAAAAREGVNVSAGWQLGQLVTYNSARLSVAQVTIDHTHYETIAGCRAATELYGRIGRPNLHPHIYGFEELPLCFQHMHQSAHDGIAIVRVAEHLPESVQGIAPWPHAGRPPRKV